MPGIAIKNWLAKWSAEKEIGDAGSEAGEAWLAEVI